MLLKKIVWTTLLALAVLALPAAGLSVLTSQPTLFRADGGAPAPPIPPTAQPTLLYADGGAPAPPIPPTANV